MFQHDATIELLTTFDDRFYQVILPGGEGEVIYLPSATHINSQVAVGDGFSEWKMLEAETYTREGARFRQWLRAERGSTVHAACERFAKGETLAYKDDDGRYLYDDFEWGCICRFAHWLETSGATILATEMPVYSFTHRFAGTLDMIAEIKGERYVIDLKTSAQVNDSHLLQIAAYRLAVNEMFPDMQVERAAVLALNAKRNKSGFQFKEIPQIGDDPKKLQDQWLAKVRLFHLAKPDFQPDVDLLPTVLTPTHIVGEMQ